MLSLTRFDSHACLKNLYTLGALRSANHASLGALELQLCPFVDTGHPEQNANAS